MVLSSRWREQSYYQELSGEGKSREDIDKIHAEQADLLDNARFVKEYVNQNGIGMPDDIKTNLDRYIAALERDEADYQYYMLQYSDDFAEGAAKGKELEAQDLEELAQNTYGDSFADFRSTASIGEGGASGIEKAVWFDFMSEEEKDTYYYLYGTEGAQAAGDYLRHLTDDTYGNLQTRMRGEVEKEGQEQVDSGLAGGALANAEAIAAAPLEAISGLLYMIDRAITGSEYKPSTKLCMMPYQILKAIIMYTALLM